MTNIMLELSQNYPMGDKWFLTALAGVGQSTIKTERYTVAGTAYGTGIETNHTSTRFGAGAGYQLSEKAKIIAMVQRSDYGKSEVKSTEGTMFEVEAVATEVGIRLRVSF